MKTSSINIGKCVRVAQAMKEVTNVEMARHFSVKPQQVVRWRNAEDMSVRRMEEIAEYCGMSLITFLSLSDAKS